MTGPDATTAAAPRRMPLQAALLIVLAALVYLPSLGGTFQIDDEYWLWDNPHIHKPTGFVEYFKGVDTYDYYPLTSTALFVQWRLFGRDAAGYRAVNIALHIAGCLLIWVIFRRIGLGETTALLAALIFALHPMNGATVGWITQQKNLWSQLFAAGAVLAYLRFDAMKRPGSYALAMLLFVAALLSKASVVMLPVGIAILLWYRHGRLTWRDAMYLAPLLLASLAAGAIALGMQGDRVIGEETVRPEGMASRIAAAGWILWFYIGKFARPWPLLMGYPRWSVDATELAAWAPLAGLILVFIVLWLRGREWGRGVPAGFGWFAVMLAPVLGIVPMFFHRFSLVNDAWTYIALPALAALAAGGLARLIPQRIPRYAVATVVLIGLSLLTFHRATVFADPVFLWTHDLQHNPQSWWAHNSLGRIRAQQGEAEAALEHFKEAARLKPQAPDVLRDVGQILLNMGRSQKATEYLERAVEIEPRDATTHYLYGEALLRINAYDRAIDRYRQCLALKPDHVDAMVQCGVALLLTERAEEAVAMLREATQRSPGDAEAWLHLAVAFGRVGRIDEAHRTLKSADRAIGTNAELQARRQRIARRLGISE